MVQATLALTQAHTKWKCMQDLLLERRRLRPIRVTCERDAGALSGEREAPWDKAISDVGEWVSKGRGRLDEYLGYGPGE